MSNQKKKRQGLLLLKGKVPLTVAIKNWIKESPAWAISIGLHLVLLLVATMVYFEHYLSTDEGEVVIKMRRRDLPKIQDLKRATEEEKGAPEEETQSAASLLQEGQDPTSPDAGSDSLEMLSGMSDRPVALGVVGSGGDRPVGYGQLRRRTQTKPKKEDQPQETEDGVRVALRWLARHQNGDGSWSVIDFKRNCGRHGFKEDCAKNAFEGNEQFDVGVTALALLAFLGAGHLPSDKNPVFPEGQELTELSEALGESRVLTYGEVVKRAIKYLLKAQSPAGMIGPDVDRFIYNHLISTLALCEAFGMTGVDFLRDHAEKAIHYLVEARSPRGGWRYSFRSTDTDSSVTGWAVMALKSAETAGIAFDRSLYDDLRRWFETVTVEGTVDPKLTNRDDKRSYLLTGYLGADDVGKLVSVPGVNDEYYYTPALTAIMIMSTAMMDRKLSSKAENAMETLLAFLPPKWSPSERNSWKGADFYYWYHATYALFQATEAGDSRWQRWNEAMKAALLDTQNLKDSKGQCKEGSWDPVDRWSCEGGRVYTTAMASLTLQVYYRYPKVLAHDKKLSIDLK